MSSFSTGERKQRVLPLNGFAAVLFGNIMPGVDTTAEFPPLPPRLKKGTPR